MVQAIWHDDDERRIIDDVQQYGWHCPLAVVLSIIAAIPAAPGEVLLRQWLGTKLFPGTWGDGNVSGVSGRTQASGHLFETCRLRNCKNG
jgi:hypothetical protein